MIHRDIFTPQSKEVMQGAFRLAMEMRHSFLGSEHLLWSLARDGVGSASQVLQRAGLDCSIIRDIIQRYDGQGKAETLQAKGLAPDADRVLELAEAQAKKLGHKQIEPEHLLLGILQEPESVAAKIIVSTGVPLDRLTTDLLELLGKGWPRPVVKAADKKERPSTKTLEQYSRDLVELANQGKLDPVIGRDGEIARVVQILSRRTKNNPVLIGEPGVGKTAVAEGLAQRIASGQVPENLLGKRILMLDLTKMVSGAKFRGDFEERIKGCIEEAAAADNIILFIDELHTLIGAGAAEGSMDAANILKPALSRGEIQVIGATTLTEYRKHIEKDSALERRFQSVLVGEPSPEDTIRILQGLRGRYEEHHKLTITDEALEAAVHLSARYIQDRYLPDKAIDLMDEAASRVRTGNLTVPEEFKVIEGRIAALTAEKEEAVRNQDFERAAMLRDMQRQLQDELSRKQDAWNATRSGSVTAEDVAAVVSSWTGIPVTMLTEDESQRLLRLEQTLHQRVIGQDEAVTAVAKAIRRGRVGLKDPKRPIGVFLFLGPTGVGKTELCKALAAAMFQDENAMIRVDMSEYMERHTVSKLIGSPPGYVGYDEGGQLTEKVRRRPYSVILFDEIEKAHPDVWSALLQIMEDGRLTDAQGRTVAFKNTIIVMTSNIGAKSITGKQKSTLGFSAADRKEGETRPLSEIKEKVMAEVKSVFSPEFFNRIDDIIVFHQLNSDHIRDIARNMVNNLAQRVAELGITLEIDDAALQVLVEKGFDPQYGARPLRRVIQTEIEDAAATAYLEGGYREGDTMLVTARNGEIVLEKKTTPKMLAVAQQ